jgi:hypothetical protein
VPWTLDEYRKLIGEPTQPLALSEGPSRWQQLVTAATQLIEQQDVTHYFTLTFARPVGSPGARALYLRWAEAVAWLNCSPVGWLRAEESAPSRWPGKGEAAIPRHYHGILVGTRDLHVGLADALWRELAGDAEIRPYRFGGGAVPYSLKKAFGRCEGDYELGGSREAFRPFEPPTT